MKKKLKYLFTLLISLFSLGSLFLGTLAWFSLTLESPATKVKGSSVGAYFAYGDGSSSSPFGINTPRHLYNLAWLQYLGYFNNHIVGPDSGPVYFEIDPEMQSALDMSQLTLPPIGTNEFPFTGYFNGNNKTISNLKIDNAVGTDHITKMPTVVNVSAIANGNILKESTGGSNYSNTNTVDAVGMFGKTTTLSPDDSTTHIYDFKLDNATISSSSNKLVVGVAVGYLDSKMSNVSVTASTINISNNPGTLTNLTNISEYTLVGYATSQFVKNGYKKIVTADKPQIDNTVRSGAGSEFGASIPMKEIYNNLLNIHNNSEPFVYDEVWNGEIGVDPENNLTKETIYSYIGNNNNNNRYAYYGAKEKDSNDEEIASYTFARRPGVDAFMYLYGEDSGTYTKHIDGVAYEDAINGGTEFAIGDGNGNWLTYSKATADQTYNVTNTTNVDDAQKWVYYNGAIRSADIKRTTTDSSGWWGQIEHHHYAYLSVTNENNNNYLRVIVQSEDDPQLITGWTFDSREETITETVINEDNSQSEYTRTITYRAVSASVSGDTSAYVIYNNSWGIILEDDDYRIMTVGPNFNDYLVIDSVSPLRVSLTNDPIAATRWYTSNNGGYKFRFNNNWYMFVTTMTKREYSGGIPAAVTAYTVTNQLSVILESNFDVDLMRPYLANSYNSQIYLGNSFDIIDSVTERTILGYVISRTSSTGHYEYYLKVNGNQLTYVTAYSSGTSFNLEGKDIRNYSLSFQTGARTENATWESYPTYFPLSYASPEQIQNNPGLVQGDVSPKNTGYIVSGSNFTYGNGNFPGDIRISDYTNNANNNRLSASLGGGSAYNNLTVITHERSANGGYVAVKDAYNTLNNVPNTLNSITSTFKTPDNLGFVRYEDSRTELHNQFTADFAHIHGLHFMNAEISMNHLITVPNAHILGQTYTNYQMPQDCIDFNLNKNGFITFYAGTYFSGNNTFFSLHEISRNGDKTISNIKEISKIYDNVGSNRANKRYIYDYSNGNNMVEGDEKGDLLFDMSWVTNPQIVNNAVYYFEIPVTPGEYALGSVAGKTGAYLMYLDIGSARKNEAITTIEEKIVTDNYSTKYVEGVDFATSNSTNVIKGGEVANVTIPSGSNGTYNFAYNNSTLTYTGSGNLTATHVGERISISNNLTNGMVQGDSVKLDKTTQVIYNDFDETLTTTVTEKTTINNGVPTIETYVKNQEINILTYDNTNIVSLSEEGTMVRFRYWGDMTLTTEVDYTNYEYIFTFDTDEPLDIYVELLDLGSTGFTVKFQSTSNSTKITAVQGEYISLNPS